MRTCKTRVRICDKIDCPQKRSSASFYNQMIVVFKITVSMMWRRVQHKISFLHQKKMHHYGDRFSLMLAFTVPADTWRLYNVASTSMQRHDVASTFRRRCINVMCPLGCCLIGILRLLTDDSTMFYPDVILNPDTKRNITIVYRLIINKYAHSTYQTNTRPESTKQAGYLQTEARQQE